MTRVRIAPPDIEEDVSAEQVAAYLLRPGSGWEQLSEENSPGWSSFMSRVGRRFVGWSNENTSPREIEEAITDIARAEQRHPSAVLADIVGPAVGSVGVACYSNDSTFEAAEARFECKAKMGLIKWMAEGPFPHAGEAWFDAWTQSIGAAHGAGEENEGA